MNAHAKIAEAGIFAKPYPTLLSDIWPAVAEHDREAFKAGAREFGSGFNATIEGAHRAMKLWVAKRSDWIGPIQHNNRIRFLAILEPYAAEIKDRRARL